jgi:hypothetical protein
VATAVTRLVRHYFWEISGQRVWLATGTDTTGKHGDVTDQAVSDQESGLSIKSRDSAIDQIHVNLRRLVKEKSLFDYLNTS